MKKTVIIFLTVITLFSFIFAVGCSSGETVKISFDLNFNTEEKMPESIVRETGKKYGTIPTVTVENEGYTFVCWNTRKDGNGEDVTANSLISSNVGDHTLYAKWQGKKYQVTFDLNGGNIDGKTEIDPVEVTYGQDYGFNIIPNTPKRKLSSFKGWFLNEDGSGLPVSYSTQVNTASNHTLYAKYGDLRQHYDFSDEKQMEDFYFVDKDSANLYSEFIVGATSNYIKITNTTENPTAVYVLKGDFKTGTKIDFDVEFSGEVSSIHDADGVKAGFFVYGANSDGSAIQQGPLGIPGTEGVSDDINRWYWGQGARNDSWEASVWNNGHIKMTMNVLEDCCGVSIKFEFGRKKDGDGYVPDKTLWENNTWRINSIDIHYAGVGAEDDPTVKHELSFDLNGGNIDGQTTLESKQVNSSMKYSTVLTANPVMDGKVFIGWFFDKDGKGDAVKMDDEIVIEEDSTLYAIFKDEISYFDFSSEEQLGYFVNVNNAEYEIVDGYLKVSQRENNAEKTFIGIRTKDLKANGKVIIKGEFVGTQGGNAGNDGIVAYGMREDGSSIGSGPLGTPGEAGVPQIITNWYWGQAVSSASWENSTWNNGQFTLYANILEDCYGVRILFRFGPNSSTAYYKITSVEILDEVTTYNFNDETVKDFVNIENAKFEVIDDGSENYLKLTQIDSTSPVFIAINSGYLKKNAKVYFEIEFYGTEGGNEDVDGVSFYCGDVGLKRLDATVKVINSASWQNSQWDSGNISFEYVVSQDCACLILRFKFGKDPQNAYYKIKSVTVSY